MAVEKNRTAVHLNVPSRFRFVPTDEELIRDYLAKKIQDPRINFNSVGMWDVALYEHSPEYLADNHPHTGDYEWYFFTSTEKRYPLGKCPNRTAGDGFWKATGKYQEIIVDDEYGHKIVGSKRSLVYHTNTGMPPKSIKTNWHMHEYKIHTSAGAQKHQDDKTLDNNVLCKIYQHVRKGKKESDNSAPMVVENANVCSPDPPIAVDYPCSSAGTYSSVLLQNSHGLTDILSPDELIYLGLTDVLSPDELISLNDINLFTMDAAPSIAAYGKQAPIEYAGDTTATLDNDDISLPDILEKLLQEPTEEIQYTMDAAFGEQAQIAYAAASLDDDYDFTDEQLLQEPTDETMGFSQHMQQEFVQVSSSCMDPCTAADSANKRRRTA